MSILGNLTSSIFTPSQPPNSGGSTSGLTNGSDAGTGDNGATRQQTATPAPGSDAETGGSSGRPAVASASYGAIVLAPAREDESAAMPVAVDAQRQRAIENLATMRAASLMESLGKAPPQDAILVPSSERPAATDSGSTARAAGPEVAAAYRENAGAEAPAQKESVFA